MTKNKSNFAVVRATIFIWTFLGVIVCLWNIFAPETFPCPTQGCSLNDTFSVFGISLWWVGTVLFAVLALCALGHVRTGYIVSTSAIILDLPLLALMLIGVPCLSCLITAALIALTYYAFRHLHSQKHAIPMIVWGLLFTMNIGVLTNGLITPWAIQSPPNPSSRIYFSPSCGACLKLALNTPVESMQNIAWCPVAKNHRDLEAIIIMEQALKNGSGFRDAIIRASEFTADPAPSNASNSTFDNRILLRLRVWINRAYTLRGGQNILPYRQTYGISRSKKNDKRSSPAEIPFSAQNICGTSEDYCK